MPDKNSGASELTVLIVDDDDVWVQTLEALFKQNSIQSEGISDPGSIFSWTNPSRFQNFDMIFLDMRLGPSKFGGAISAGDVLLHILTYCPTAKAVVFTQQDVTVEECVRCIQIGALGFIPKMSGIADFVLVANVYGTLGDATQAVEERIRSLWAMLEGKASIAKGRHLEMLATNLFNSISGFKVIAHNSQIMQGELDLVVENTGEHAFWKTLNSLHVIVECKNEKITSEKEVFNILAQKVIGKSMCEAGILVSWSGVTSGFRQMQTAEAGRVKIFVLDKMQLLGLIKQKPAARESFLRNALQSQF
jgi:ActR/RegA family two-component response regulator/Holliday junction resolvase-like predicted endonuclease